ncbi:MAG: acetoacetate--CoA ligase [Herpetosiphon sp.]
MTNVTEGTIMWQPPQAWEQNSTLLRYMGWLKVNRQASFTTYNELWQWSTDNIEDFWGSIWQFFDVRSSAPYSAVLESHDMPGTRWFTGARLNYAEQVFRRMTTEQPAVMFQSEIRPLVEMSWADLYAQVASAAAGLRALGLVPGDRVVAYLPNIPQALVAFLACASLGVVWSSCSPDFGSPSVIDRFKQIAPRVLIAIDGYQYGGKQHDRRTVVHEIQQALPTLEQTVFVPYLFPDQPAPSNINSMQWDELLATTTELQWQQVPFDHPLWVLYSSGTTGLPKPIVHGQGGIVLEHLKSIGLQQNLGPGDRYLWFTTTGWMMWNHLVGALLHGVTVVLYDGSPAYPDLDVLWQLVERAGVTMFGTSAGYITSLMKAGVEPGRDHDLSKLNAIGSTGSPLPVEGFQWIYDHVRSDLWLVSTSGGTDVCTSFVTGCPILPVRAGEIQSRSLGCKVEAWDEGGHPLIDQVGELVISEPMPSMPLYFWNDPDNKRYAESYFSMYPGVWRHGDWIKITPHGSAIIYGRSDSTLNRMGVRMGTSELYSAVEAVPEVLDSMIIDLEVLGRDSYMPLFVKLQPGVELTADLTAKIKSAIRRALSPRHVPDDIVAVPEIPRTLNGKKMEVPVKKILMGSPPEKAANLDSMSNPDSLQPFVEFGARLKTSPGR